MNKTKTNEKTHGYFTHFATASSFHAAPKLRVCASMFLRVFVCARAKIKGRWFNRPARSTIRIVKLLATKEACHSGRGAIITEMCVCVCEVFSFLHQEPAIPKHSPTLITNDYADCFVLDVPKLTYGFREKAHDIRRK